MHYATILDGKRLYIYVEVLNGGRGIFISAPTGYELVALKDDIKYLRHGMTVTSEDAAKKVLEAGLAKCSLSPCCVRCDGYLTGSSLAGRPSTIPDAFRADEDWRAARRTGSKSWQLQRARARAKLAKI